MASLAAQALNRSARTLADVYRLAEQSPAEAEGYLQNVVRNLLRAGEAALAREVERVLEGSGGLVERMRQNAGRLGLIFPETPHDWGELQSRRAGTIGWSAAAASEATYLQGTVRKEGRTLVLTTPGGTIYQLADSSKAEPMPGTWMQGLIGDGPVSVVGTLGSDGRTFNVEGFALNADGNYETFTFGRVAEKDGETVVKTSRGDVYITDPSLRAQLRPLPHLGVILPGAPKVENGRQIYDGSPDEFYVLGRFMETTWREDGGKKWVSCDMALSTFSRGRCEIPDAYADRVGHMDRLWLKGSFMIGHDGRPAQFVASYVSLATDDARVVLPGGVPEADPVRAAVVLAEAGEADG